jgi:DNA-directed RNA polymerase subunit RPC12/RpoP
MTITIEWQCPRCQTQVILEYVHGHYQCPRCKSVIVDCCQGETAQETGRPALGPAAGNRNQEDQCHA